MERRYSNEEIEQIFGKAISLEASQEEYSRGLTRTQVYEIAKDVGVDEKYVDDALVTLEKVLTVKTSKTISLEGIANRVFEIRQLASQEVDTPCEREIEKYLRTNKKPKLPLLPFSKKRRMAKEQLRAYRKGISEIHEKYQNHPLILEWAELQKLCPHKYGPWEDVPPTEVSTCSICYKRRSKIMNSGI